MGHRGLSRAAATVRLRLALLSTALAFSAIGVLPAIAVAQQGAVYAIPAGSLDAALSRFGATSGVQLLYNSALTRGLRSSGAAGSLSPEAALERILNGTGLSYSFTNPTTVTITNPAAASADAGLPGEGETTLETIVISSGTGAAQPGMPFTPDTPYQTAGSVSHISSEQLSRVPVTSPGDMFVSTPGVLNGGNRVGNSLNPNIRGLQGMGRVNTTVDGALNSTTSYRGYAGTRDETYVDPDMIGGIDITKGPSEGVGGGAIGGNIAMRTLNAEDIVKDGENWGIRFKGGIGTGTLTPPDKRAATDPKIYRDEDRPNSFNGDSWSGSVAAATFQDNFEAVIAYTRRKQGNYFAGNNNAADGFIYAERNLMVPGKNATVRPGDEVYNTSEDTKSFLAKGKLKWGDGQSFELGFMRYDSLAGEEDEALINGIGSYGTGQLMLSRTKLDTYTARYRNNPSDNPWINLRANLWHTDLEHKRGQAYPEGIRDHSVATTGGDISNTALIDTEFGNITLDGGVEFRYESAEAPIENAGFTSRGPNGERMIASGFAKASIEPTDWLMLSAGLRYDYFEANGNDIAALYPERSGSRLSPNFGVVLKPLDGVQLFAQYKEGYRPPSLRELYWELYSLQVNPDLQGEVSKNWELGFNFFRDDVFHSGDKLGFKASYFRNRYEDYIMMDSVPGSMGATQHFTNIDRANYQGIELSGTYDSGGFFVEGSFTKYLKAEYCSAEKGCYMPGLDETLANVTPPTYVPPEWSGSATLGVRLFDEAMTIGSRATFSSKRIGADWPPEHKPLGGLIGLNYTWPEFVVFDLFGSYKFSEDSMLNFSIENLTDQYYYGPLATTGMPSPGRTARLSYTHRIGGAGVVNIPEIGSLGRASVGAPGDDWTGLYVGGHLGFGSGDVSGRAATLSGAAVAATEAADYSDNGRAFGAQIGYNHQFANNWIVGLEGDFSLLNRKSGVGRTFSTEAGYAGQLASETEYELDWTASLRARLGYSFGRLMVFGTGGLGFLQQSGTRTQYRANAARTATEEYFAESDSAAKLGWTLGAGAEYAIANNWSIKGEYAYSKFGSSGLAFSQARKGVTRSRWGVVSEYCFEPDWCEPVYGTIPGTSDSVEGRKASSDVGVHQLKLGLNYRF